VCIRDIEIGDQITCDYDLIEYDCADKGIDCCACGSASCRTKIWGFKHLEEGLKEVMIEYAFDNVLREALLAGEISQEVFDKVSSRRQAETADDFK
jgi:hypothetical protein